MQNCNLAVCAAGCLSISLAELTKEISYGMSLPQQAITGMLRSLQPHRDAREAFPFQEGQRLGLLLAATAPATCRFQMLEHSYGKAVRAFLQNITSSQPAKNSMQEQRCVSGADQKLR